MTPPKLLTPTEVAKQLGVSERALSVFRYKRKIEFIRLGGQARFTQEQVDRFLEASVVAAKS
jgi:excisionase family DNA binding protein